MSMDNQIVFEMFKRKAKEKLEEKKKQKTKKLHIGALDMDITVRKLTEEEIGECQNYSEDSMENDKYLIYMASKDLQELAVALVEEGALQTHHHICNMFNFADRHRLAKEVMRLSGVYDESTVSEVDEAKNC